MGAKVITIAQQKGGAGKTTIAAHLAVAWAREDFHVGLLDIDPQGSLSQWFAQRRQNIAEAEDESISLVKSAGWRTQGEVDRLRSACDIIIIDSPPHIETEARIAIRAADLLLVPVQPSPMDLWATLPTLKLAEAEKTKALVVLNRMPPRGALADVVVSEIPRLGAAVANSKIGNRISFAAALVNGYSVSETEKNSKATQEIEALAQEVSVLLGLGFGHDKNNKRKSA